MAQSIYRRGRLTPCQDSTHHPEGRQGIQQEGPFSVRRLDKKHERACGTPLSYACSRFTKTSTASASYPASTLLFSSNTSSSVFQRGQMNLDQHLQIQGSLFGQGSRGKGLLSPTEPPRLLPGHHPVPTVPGDLLTTCHLWGAVPTPQNIELSMSTNSKALAEAVAREMI